MDRANTSVDADAQSSVRLMSVHQLQNQGKFSSYAKKIEL